VKQYYEKIINIGDTDQSELGNLPQDMKFAHMAYSEYSKRGGHHNWGHIQHMFNEVIHRDIELSFELIFAIIGHDVCYETTVADIDNIRRSIEWTSEQLSLCGLTGMVNVGIVTEIILSTSKSCGITSSDHIKLMHDLDYSYFIDTDVHATAIKNIRREYPISIELFAMGRFEFLTGIQRDLSVFKSQYYNNADEMSAKSNIEREIEAIKDGCFDIYKTVNSAYRNYIRHGVCDIDDILPHVQKTVKGGPKHVRINRHGFDVKVSTLRLQTFKKSIKCAHCGCEGSFFAVEGNFEGDSPHFNMYTIKDGEEMLMTKDHIIPKAKGGRDHIDNLQTMCYECNQLKGDK
jgi:predicted metal-dependent HD superfamily phosphohydrolase/5-methylcytosine-specific restriction endonuclease McrA